MAMTLQEVEARRFRIEDAILSLQDIALEGEISKEERSMYVGVRWHSDAAVQRAKERINELKQELEELGEQENLLRAQGVWF